MAKVAATPNAKDDKPLLKTVADNRRARHDYEIVEVFEAGIALVGTEVNQAGQSQPL